MIIVTHPDLIEAAQKLADFRIENDGMEVVVANVLEIYNEFSSGAQDITAIRDFVKMIYDRANGDPEDLPKYLCLMGDGSYDYKNIEYTADANTNKIPVYENLNSIHPVTSFVSDDFYALLDDGEGDNLVTANVHLDIAIGRFPANSAQEADDMVEKVIHYSSSEATFGSWRNTLAFVADDEDSNLHLRDADEMAEIVKLANPQYNLSLIHI